MTITRQAGYMDVQFTPVIIGAMLLVVVLSQMSDPGFDPHAMQLRFYGFLLLAVAAMLYGFGMHLDALAYPESPFNKHSSPVFMTLLCAAPLLYGAYRFYRAGMYPVLVLFSALAVMVCVVSIGFAWHRKRGHADGRD